LRPQKAEIKGIKIGFYSLSRREKIEERKGFLVYFSDNKKNSSENPDWIICQSRARHYGWKGDDRKMHTRFRPSQLVLSLVLAALVFATYWNTLSGDFVYDDNEQIVENTWITDSKFLPSIFSSHSFGFAKGKELGTTYRPLVFSVYMAEYSFFGLAPKGWHFINIVFHALNTVLVFFTASLLLKGTNDKWLLHLLPPFAVAALFALHPVNSEVVSWVGCVPELVYTLLCLSAFYIYIRSRSAAVPFLLHWASAMLFFFALFAKETAISLPMLIFVYDLLQPKKEKLLSIGTVKRYFPYAFFTILYFIIRLSALGGMAPRGNMYPYLSWDQYVLNACTLFLKYLRVLIVPVHDYPFQVLDPVFSISEPRAFISVALIALMLPIFLLLRKRVNPLYWLAATLIIVPLLPALYLPGLSRAPFADRYLYLPSMGFALILAMLFKKALAQAETVSSRELRTAAISAFLILAIFYAIGSGYRNLRWRNNFTLWRSSLEGASNNYYAMYQLGTASLREDKHEEAITNFREAIRTTRANKYPDTGLIGDARMNLAYAYKSKGLLEEAAAEYQKILRSYPEHPVSNYELASIYMERGMLDDAIAYFARSANYFRDPMDIRDALLNIGNCQVKKGNFDEALLSYQEALRITPGDPAVLKNISVVKRLSGT
jgi:tetratricopeptide (TPR) repeat protein